MPVADVKAVLTAPDAASRSALIAAHLDRLEAGLARTRAAVDSLRNLLQPPDTAPAIEHRSVPATPAAAIRQVVDRDDVLPWWEGALGELHASHRAQHLKATGPSGGLYASELFQHDRGEATVFIPVAAVRAIGRVAPVVIPPAELAIIGHPAPRRVDLTAASSGSYALPTRARPRAATRVLSARHHRHTRPADGNRDRLAHLPREAKRDT